MDLLIPAPPELGNTAVELENAGAKVGEGATELVHERDPDARGTGMGMAFGPGLSVETFAFDRP